jgi:uncharacterized protein
VQTDAYIETASGKKFFVDHPEFDLKDIASTLSKLCRFGGHCREFYSVAEHAVLVSRIMEIAGDDPKEGLHHDDDEGYLIDMPSPLKALLPDYRALEKKISVPLRLWQGLPPEKTPECKRADWIAMFIEAYHLMPTRGENWFAPPGVRERAEELRWELKPLCMTPFAAEHQFLFRHNQLQNFNCEAGR